MSSLVRSRIVSNYFVTFIKFNMHDTAKLLETISLLMYFSINIIVIYFSYCPPDVSVEAT